MNIVISGCSQGIGYETVLAIPKLGNHKIIGISRSVEPLNLLEKTISGSSFKGLVFDITKIYNQPSLLIDQIVSSLGHIDVLINMAGYLSKQPFKDFSKEDIQKIFETNLFAPAELIKLLLPFMGKANRSHIVNIGSMGGFQGSLKFPGLSWYSVSKAAISSLTECLSKELKDSNIVVNCLALGSVQTEMLSIAFPGYKAPVSPKEMGEYIADFALNKSHIFNGQIIPVTFSNPLTASE
jgi:3-oxoacyl-[acyl-carrier protein] reductase